MLENIRPEQILFLDIETAPQYPDFDAMPEQWKKLWEKKSAQKRQEQTAAEYYPSAGIFAEFGKIVCICCGYFSMDGNRKTFRLKSFYGEDEKVLLEDFASLLNKHFYKNGYQLCAHNGKEFDFPFIARRMVIQGVALPAILDLAGKKPWEVSLLDTLELWKFGDYKNFTSVELLAAVLGIPTPKDDIDGSMIYKVYWQEKNTERIVTYCKKDVITIARIFQRLRNETFITDEDVLVAD